MSLTIPATDGYSLGATEFASPAARAVVIITPATGVPQKFYSRFARWLSDRGAHVITFDYRGIGASRPASLKHFKGTMADWGKLDLEGVIGWAASRYPALPLALLGHSVGGQLLGFPSNNTKLTRIVTVASQSGYWKHWPLHTRPVMATLWYTAFPLVPRLFGYVPGQLGIGEDLPEHIAREWARWGRSPNYLVDYHPETREGFARITAPVLAFSISDDFYAPKAAVDWLHALYTSKVERRHLTPRDLGVKKIGHFAAFRESFSNSLWPQFAEGLGL